MSMPTTIINNIDKTQAENNVMASISLEETALSHIINAEGAKLQKLVSLTGVTPDQLLAVNDSAGAVLSGAMALEAGLVSKYKTVYSGLDALIGPKGPTGAAGATAASAYDAWLAQGNDGSTAEFLASLIGPTGAIGPTGPAGLTGAPGADGGTGPDGSAGETGATGASVYDVWLAEGNSGDESDFLAAIVGPTGAAGATGAPGITGSSTGIYHMLLISREYTTISPNSNDIHAFTCVDDPDNYVPIGFGYDLDYGSTGVIITPIDFTSPPEFKLKIENQSSTEQDITIYSICLHNTRTH
jgi:hypothetical protein